MPEAFDTGSLSWVKDEIDQSLTEVNTHYIALAEDLSKVDGLQMALAHLYQVQGALDMVGLEGCQIVCQTIFAVTDQLKDQQLTATASAVETVQTALTQLGQYLDDLMQGSPDLPMRLTQSYEALLLLQDKEPDPAALFLPDTSFRPPAELASRQKPSVSLPLFIADQRIAYQKALTEWIVSKDDAALKPMRAVLQSVQSVQEKALQISLWWVASTFISCLEQPAILQMNGAKKLCRKLDQQLRDLATGDSKRSATLLKELLYFVGHSEGLNKDIVNVKRIFELPALLNAAAEYPLTLQEGNAPWESLLPSFAQTTNALKQQWVTITQNLWHTDGETEVDQALLQSMVQTNDGLIDSAEPYAAQREKVLVLDGFMQLAEALQKAYAHLSKPNSLISERLAMAVASTITLQEQVLAEQDAYTDTQHEAVMTQSTRLLQLLEVTAEETEEVAQNYDDDEVTVAVAQQVIECLIVVEKSVDAFFRAANEVASLNEGIQQLKPVVAAFDMLEMSTPKMMAKLAVIYLEQFETNALPDATAHPNQAQFEVLAEAISLLGLFSHDLPEERQEVKQAMADSLQQLEQNMDALLVDEADMVEYPASLDHDRRVADRREVGRLNAIKEAREAQEIEIVAEDAQAEEVALPIMPEEALATEETQEQEEKASFNLTPVVERGVDEELQSIFITEAEELLEHNRLNLAALRANADHEVALTEVRRAYHTLKGSGRTVGLEVLAEVAYSIEKLLNVLIEYKAPPSNEILDFVSLCNDSFFDWIETLKEVGQVTLNAGEYQQQAAEMAALLQQSLLQKEPSVKKEEVLIGGSRKVGRAFFYLFLGEAQQHLNTLIAERRSIDAGSSNPPSASCRRAAHTLSSNALTAGFDAIGDLSRALENWFDEFYGNWTESHLALFTKVINALKDGLEKAKNLQHPKSTRGLIIELSKTTAAMQVQANQHENTLLDAIDDHDDLSLSDDERLGSSLSAEEITTSRIHSDEVNDEYDDDLGSLSDEAEPQMEVEALEEKDAEKVRYALKAPVFIPESELENVFEAFTYEPRPEAESQEASDPEEDSLEVKLQTISTPLIVEPSKAASGLEAVPPKPEIREKVLSQDPPQPLLQPSLVRTPPAKPSKAVDAALTVLFIEEASELIPRIGKELREWKAAPDVSKLKTALQRDLHTLKGSARTAGQLEIGDLAHEIEDKLEASQKQMPSLNDFDALFVDYDRICLLLDQLQTRQARLSQAEVVSDEQGASVDEMPQDTENDSAVFVGATHADASENALNSPYLRVPAAKLDQLVSESGEVSILRARLERDVHALKGASTDLTLSVSRLRTYLKELELEADAQLQSRMTAIEASNQSFDPLEMDRFTRLQELTRLMAESLHDISTIQNGMVSNIDQADVALIQQNRMNRGLQKGLMAVRMMPFASIAERLRRIVRQISRELGKQVELEIIGEEIELDRSVLEQIGAPLEHLLRNAVVHGIELPEARQAAGKAEIGRIQLSVALEKEEIKITIKDDGHGIDLSQVKTLALARGLIQPDQPINDEALIAAIFESGFTTRHAVSKNAGRGIGLDAVKSDIANLNGRIDLNNQPGQGLLFNIYLPVSMSVTQVLVVKVNGQQFAIPSVMIEQVQTLKQQALAEAYAAQSIEWKTQKYPLHFFARLIGEMEYDAKHQAYTPMVFLRSGQYKAVIHVDEVVGNQEVVMKPLGTQLSRVPGIIGATVLGDGAIVYVMNPVQLVHREALTTGVTLQKAMPVEKVKKLALVVDDSLTMRKALSRILEKDGMTVITANDGMDAIQKLNEVQPDVILTDIEMPRMDGFEFAKQLKQSDRTKSLPLVMISSRSAQKHHDQAKAIGVNAFLGKPVQDDVLLKAVHTLMPI